ncbi:MAG: DUF1700 domain-containing protein [Clostridia bacterium]
MTKENFLFILKNKLSTIPQVEKEKWINYYSEIIEDGKEDGLSEQEVIDKLETPDEIAKKIIEETPIQVLIKEKANSSKNNILVVILAVIGFPLWFPLIMALFAVVLSLYFTCWILVLSFFILIFSLAICTITTIISGFFIMQTNLPTALLIFSIGLISAALSIILFFPSIKFTKIIIRFTKFISKKIKQLFIKTFITNGKESTEMMEESIK